MCKSSICFLLFFGIFSIACRQLPIAVNPTIELPSQSSAFATSTASVVSATTPSSLLVQIPLPTTMPDQMPTPTTVPSPSSPLPVPTATLSPTLTTNDTASQTFLTIRQPTFEQLAIFLKTALVDVYSPESRAIKSMRLKSDEAINSWDVPLPKTQFYYEDVNADGEEDLMLLYAEPFMWGPAYFIVMLWEKGHYNQPLMVIDGSKLGASSKYELANFIGSDAPEIIWTSRTGTSGAGYGEYTYMQYVLHCEQICAVIWHTQLVNYWYGDNMAFFDQGLTTSKIQISEDQQQIRTISTTFSIPFIYEDRAGNGKSSPLHIFDTIEQRYDLVDNVYMPISSTVITKEFTLMPEPILEASDALRVAELSTEFIPAQDGEHHHYDCSIQINDVIISERFPCNPYFSRLGWQDVTGDGPNELFLQTLYQDLQKIYIWQYSENGFHQIAAVSGSINQYDLSDMSLENIDNDPELELLAGRYGYQTNDFCFESEDPGGMNSNCWFEVTLDQIVYDWNGNEYVEVTDFE